MRVQDTASQSSVVFETRYSLQHDWKDTTSGVHVHVSPGSTKTLVRRGGL